MLSHLKWVMSYVIPLQLLKDFRMILYCILNFVYSLGLYIPIDFLPDAMVKEHGITHLHAGNIITFFGMFGIIGRLLGGVITNYKKNSALLLNCVCILAICISCIGMAFSVYYWQFVVCISIYGIFVGMVPTLAPILLVDMFEVKCLKDSYGILMFVNGISTLLGAPLAGWLKEIWGNYVYVFLITAGIFGVGGILALALLWENKKDKYVLRN